MIRKATETFKNKHNGYETVVDRKPSLCVWLLLLEDLNTFLRNKRKADEIPRMEALHKKQSSNKTTKRTPNTTWSNNGVIVNKKLCYHDNNAGEENQQIEMKKLENKWR